MSSQETPLTIDDLAAAVRELVDEYPTDDPQQRAGALIVIGGTPDGGEHVALQPGHVAWLTALIRRELVTAREAHAGGTGECGHCGHVPAGEDADDVDERERQDAEDAAAGRPGDMVQDDDGSVYIHCADGLMRLADAEETPYTPAELDAERGPLMPIEARSAAARQQDQG